MNSDQKPVEPGFLLFHLDGEEPRLFHISPPADTGNNNLVSRHIMNAKVNLEVAEKIASRLGLTYLPEEDQVGNVCMANSDEVMPEFRANFTAHHLRKYVSAVLHSSGRFENLKKNTGAAGLRIPFPDNARVFWQRVNVDR